MAENIERELGWDDSIENDGGDYILLPEGDYDFVVKTFERGRHTGSDKLPPCNKAVLAISIDGKNGEGTITLNHSLFLHTKTEGLLCAFFTAIGQRQRGERLSMNWQDVPGSRGRCKLGIHTFKGKNGDDITTNEIKKFYEPEPKPAGSVNNSANPQGFTPGKF